MGRGSDAPLEIAGPPSSVLEQIEDSSVWSEPPLLFETADDTLSFPGDTAWSVAAVESGDVIALTPEELADQAVRYQGVPVYVVGRVEDVRAVPDQFGMENEVRLTAADGSVAYLGSGQFLASEGDLIFALGRIAAVGQARLPSGAPLDVAYLLTLNPSSGVDYDTWAIDLVGRANVSPAIRWAVERVSPD